MPQHIPGTGNNTGSGNAGGGSGSAQDNTTGSGNAAATGPTGAAGELTGMAALGPAYEALQASLAELRKVGEAAERRRAGGEQAAPASGTGGDDAEDLDRVFAEIVSGWDEAAGDPAPADGSADPGDGQADQAAQPPVTSVGPPVDGPAVMLQVLRGAERGMHWEQLLTALEAQGVAVAKATLYRWLRDAEAAGQAHSPTRGWWAPGSPRQ